MAGENGRLERRGFSRTKLNRLRLSEEISQQEQGKAI
jgi:hypothetical protein